MLRKEIAEKVKAIAVELKPLFNDARKLNDIASKVSKMLMPKKEQFENERKIAFSVENYKNGTYKKEIERLNEKEKEIDGLKDQLTVADQNYLTQLEIISKTAAELLQPLFNDLWDRRGYDTAGEIIRSITNTDEQTNERLFIGIYTYKNEPTLEVLIYAKNAKPRAAEFNALKVDTFTPHEFITVADYRKAKAISAKAYEDIKRIKQEASAKLIELACYTIVNLDFLGR